MSRWTVPAVERDVARRWIADARRRLNTGREFAAIDERHRVDAALDTARAVR